VCVATALVLAGCASGGAEESPEPTSSSSVEVPAETPSSDPVPSPPEPSEAEEGRGDIIPEEPELSPPTTETTTMVDPVAQSFTVEVPSGWDSTAFSTGMYSDHRTTVISVSPDASTVLFVGDPALPDYWVPSDPNNQTDAVRSWVDMSERAVWSEYQDAGSWVAEWVQGKFSALDGFVMHGTEDLPDDAAQIAQMIAQATGAQVMVTAARASFEYASAAGTMSGSVRGVTFGGPQTWAAQVQGLSTLGNVGDYEPMVQAMSTSLQTTPEWASRQQDFWQGMTARSEAFTQQLIANHHANMEWIRTSSVAHQQKMESIWAANDASMASYYQRMDSLDSSRRSFLNYIQGEHTVRNSSGQSFQVAQGADVYYVNPSTGQSLGGDVRFSEQDLVEMGLDPSDWTLTEIVR